MLAVFDRQAESLMVFYEEKTGDLFSPISSFTSAYFVKLNLCYFPTNTNSVRGNTRRTDYTFSKGLVAFLYMINRRLCLFYQSTSFFYFTPEILSIFLLYPCINVSLF